MSNVAIILGIAFAFTFMLIANINDTNEFDIVNQKNYESACKYIAERYAGDFKLEPHITCDGFVSSYAIVVNNKTIGYMEFAC